VASRDPADELRAAIEHTAAGFGAALRPLAEAYLRAADQAGQHLTEWARQVGEALAASHGVRAELGDPTGDPPIHTQQPFEQHPSAWTWRARCSCGWRGEWRGSPDRAQSDWTGHRRDPGFTCPRCGRTSHHPADLAQGYCGACHDWTGRPRRG
jgi:hypothetical protein